VDGDDDDEEDSDAMVYDLVITLEHMNDAKDPGVLHRDYIDWLCDNPGQQKHDTYYVQTVLHRLISDGTLRGFKQIHLISDGGPKHFKNKFAMRMASEFGVAWRKQYPDVAMPELQWHFYAAYHGHSLCDSHAGRAKTAVRSAQRNAQHDAGGALAIGKVPRSAEDVGHAIVDRCKSTTVQTLPAINRPDERSELRHLKAGGKGIKSYYSFRFPGEPGEVECRALSGVGEWIATTVEEKAPAAAAAAAAAPDEPRKKSTRKRMQSGRASIDDDDDYDPDIDE